VTGSVGEAVVYADARELVISSDMADKILMLVFVIMLPG
jgi:hypothetical protein